MRTNKDDRAISGIDLLISLVIVTCVCVIYLQVVNFGFINYDDGDYVTGNAYVQKGLSVETFIWAFKSFDASNWHPITWLSHLMDVELFGMRAGYHHLINVYLHILNTLLVFYVLSSATKKSWQSGAVAALFALHPLHVESVAWISERKDVLSTFFGLLSIAFYIRYVRDKRSLFWVVTIFVFVLGLMSKPMLVTLPVILIGIDFWPLGRIPVHQLTTKRDLLIMLKSLTDTFREKTLFFICVIFSCALTFIAQHRGGAVGTFEAYPIYVRLTNAIMAYVIYLKKIFWPVNLDVFYPHARHVAFWQWLGASFLLLFITGIALKQAAKRPFIIMGWLWYLITLLPVIGIVQVGAQGYADRYTYIPSIGIFIIIAWGAGEAFRYLSIKPWLIGATGGALVLLMMQLSFMQISYWQNSETLFTHSIQVSKNNFLAHNNLACALSNQGRIEEAIHHYERAIEIYPTYIMAYNNLALSLMEQSRFQEGIQWFEKALHYNPRYNEAYYYMGNAYIDLGLIKKGVTTFRQLFEKVPGFKDMNANYGFHLMQAGRSEEALLFFRYAALLKSDFTLIKPDEIHDPPLTDFGYAYDYHRKGEFEKAADYYLKVISKKEGDLDKAYVNYGALLAEKGRMAEGLVYLNKSLDLDYMPPELFNNFGVAHLKQGKLVQATRYLTEALRRKPEFKIACNNLGVVMFKQGRYQESFEKFQTALGYDSHYVKALNNSGIIMALQNEWEKALSCFEKSLALNPENADTCYHLAALYASKEDLEKGLFWLEEALHKGFENSNLIKNDLLIAPLRSLPAYKGLSPHIQTQAP